uniref:Uncharacterized protein n=1 Tax=Glossina pallidipes TaxID=7398 RepID=A0A1A9Z8U8_GLOPL
MLCNDVLDDEGGRQFNTDKGTLRLRCCTILVVGNKIMAQANCNLPLVHLGCGVDVAVKTINSKTSEQCKQRVMILLLKGGAHRSTRSTMTWLTVVVPAIVTGDHVDNNDDGINDYGGDEDDDNDDDDDDGDYDDDDGYDDDDDNQDVVNISFKGLYKSSLDFFILFFL